MKFIHLDEVGSTNEVLKEKAKSENLANWTVLYANSQRQGKGQRGSSWQSEAGKNVVASIYFKPNNLSANSVFALNQWVALAVKKAILNLGVTNVEVKWPNDILVNRKKVAGILIENSIAGSSIEWSVIGIGINVNSNPNLAHATNLKSELLSEIEYFDVMVETIACLRSTYKKALSQVEALSSEYLSNLYGVGELVKVEIEGQEALATVAGVLPNGKVELLINNQVRQFGLKEFKWLLEEVSN